MASSKSIDLSGLENPWEPQEKSAGFFGLGKNEEKGLDLSDLENPYDGEAEPQSSNPIRRAVADPLVGLAKGAAVGIPETVVGLLDIPTMGHAGKVAETVSRGLGLGDFKSANEMFDNLLTPETREAQQKVAEAKGFLPTIATAIQNPSSIVQTVAESIPAMVTGMRVAGGIAKLAGKPLVEAGVANLPRIAKVGGMAEGAITAGQNIEQTRQQTEEGTLTPSQVAINTASGILTGILGVTGAKLAKRMKIEDVDMLYTAWRNGMVGDKEKGIFKKILMGAFQEGVLEELPQSMQEQIAQNLALNKPIDDGVFEAGAMGMLAGFAQSTGANIAGSTMRKMKNELDPINQTIKKLVDETLPGELNAIGGWDNGKPTEAVTPEPIATPPVVEPVAPEPIIPEPIPPAPVAPENIPAPEPLASAETSTIETPEVKAPEIVEPAANVEGKQSYIDNHLPNDREDKRLQYESHSALDGNQYHGRIINPNTGEQAIPVGEGWGVQDKRFNVLTDVISKREAEAFLLRDSKQDNAMRSKQLPAPEQKVEAPVPQNVFTHMPDDQLKSMADNGVQGAKDEQFKRNNFNVWLSEQNDADKLRQLRADHETEGNVVAAEQVAGRLEELGKLHREKQVAGAPEVSKGGQQKIYRGQPTNELQKVAQSNAVDNILFGRGIFTTTSKEVANSYGGHVLEFEKPTGKIFNLSNASEGELKKLGLEDRTIKIYKDSIKSGRPQDIKDAEDIIVEAMADKYVPEDTTWNAIKMGMPELVDRGITPDIIRDKMVADLQNAGYDWWQYKGGARIGGKGEHDVYVALSDKVLNSKPPIANQEQLKQRLSEGKPVPPEVLKDYPELAKQVAGAPEVSKGGEQELITEARKYKTAEEFVKAQGDPLYHSTKTENIPSINQKGFTGDIGEMSGKTGGKMEKGVFLYSDKESADIFGKNFKDSSTIETRVNGKIYDANSESKYGWEDDLQIQEIAKDKKIINQLRNDGYVGVNSVELGNPATFVFEPKAIKTKADLTSIWNKAQEGKVASKPPITNQEQLKQRLAEGKRLAAEKRAEVASKPITPAKTNAATFGEYARELGYDFPVEVEKTAGYPTVKFKELNKKLLKKNNTSFEQLYAGFKASKTLTKEVSNETKTQTLLTKTKHGDIHPNDTWGGYDKNFNDTVRQSWKNKLEDFENDRKRTIQENGDTKTSRDTSYRGENEVSLRRRLRDRRFLDAKIKESTSAGEATRWSGRKISKSFGDSVEFQYADEHFSKLGFEVVPIDKVEWGGAVDHGVKVVFLGEMYGDRFAYFMAHETSHILSAQGNPSIQAIKNAVDLTNPAVAEQQKNYGWTDDYTRDEFAASIVGGITGSETILKSNQDENVKAAREATTGEANPTKTDISFGDLKPLDYISSYIPDSLSSWFKQTSTNSIPPSDISQTNGTWEALQKTPWDAFMYSIADRQIDLRDTQKAIGVFAKSIGKLISDTLNPSQKEQLFSSRLSKRTSDFATREFRQVTNEMDRIKATVANFDDYLHARHAPEANDYIRSLTDIKGFTEVTEGKYKGDYINENGHILSKSEYKELSNSTVDEFGRIINDKDEVIGYQDGGSGMSTKDANDYLEALDPKTREQYEKIALMVDKITRKNAQLLVEYGVESQDTIDKWFKAYKHYVPLFREDIEERPGTGRGFSVYGKASQMRKGSERKVVNILSNISMQRERYLTKGEKNRIDQALVFLEKEFPNEKFWTSYKIPDMKTYVPRGQKVETAENVIIARIPNKETGKIEHIALQFNSKNDRAMRMVKALKNMDMDTVGEVMGVISKITRYVASINTQYNPVFGLTNFFRDLSTGLLNLSTTPIAGKQKEVAKGVLPAMKGIFSALRGDMSSAEAKLFEEYQLEGGQVGYRNLWITSEDRAKEIEKELKSLQAGKPKQYLSRMAKVLSDYNATMENAVRLSAYKVGIESGMTKEQAAVMAKNLTVNFNKKGQIAGQAGALYAFFNASVQGAVRMYETLHKEGGAGWELSSAGKKIVAGGIILGATQAMMLAAAGFKDEEPPEFVKERNIVIPTGGKKYITFPMPLGFNVIPNVGRILAEITLGGGKNAGVKMSNLIGVITETFNPLGSSGLSMQTVAPTFLDPFAALAENKDWTGRPIYKKDFNALNPTPGTSRVKDSATVFGRGLAWAFNILTGGDKYTPGMFSPTPDQIDYLGGQITGGLGREIGKTSMMLESLYTGNELPTYRLPLTSRFYGSAEGQANESNKYYSNLKKLNVHEANIKGRIKDREPIGEYIRDNPEAKLWRMANTIENTIGKIKKRKEIARTPEAKKTYDKLITIQQKRLNDMMERVGG